MLELEVLGALLMLCIGVLVWASGEIASRQGEQRLGLCLVGLGTVAFITWSLTAWFVQEQGKADLVFSVFCVGPIAAAIAASILTLILVVFAEFTGWPEPKNSEREASDHGRLIWSPSTGFTKKKGSEQGNSHCPDRQEPG